jgi:hypothetical protein
VQYPFKYPFILGCLLIVSVCSSSLHAQSYDTTVAVEEYSGTEDEPQDDENDEYFKPKWMEGSEMNPLVLRQLPDSSIEELKKDKSFWYADSVFRRRQTQRQQVQAEPPQDTTSFTRPARAERYKPVAQRSWFQTLLWIVIIGGFVAFMSIYLMNSNVRLFNKKGGQLGTTEEEEPEMDDIFAINYQKEVDRAAKAGNYRLAIRLMFLRLLKNLSERNIIQYKHDRTNLDYLMQLSTTSYYKDFFRITRNYEYSWYGKFPVSEDVYNVIKNDFDQFDPTIK